MDTAPVILFNDSWEITLTPEQWQQSMFLQTYREAYAGDEPDESRVDVLDNKLEKKVIQRAVGVLSALAEISRIRKELSSLSQSDLSSVDSLIKRMTGRANYVKDVVKLGEFSTRWLAPNPDAIAYVNLILTIYKNPIKAETLPETYKDRALFFLHFWGFQMRCFMSTREKYATKERRLRYRDADPLGYRRNPVDAVRVRLAITYENGEDSYLLKIIEHTGVEGFRWWWDTFGGDDIVEYNKRYWRTIGITEAGKFLRYLTPEIAAEFKTMFQL